MPGITNSEDDEEKRTSKQMKQRMIDKKLMSKSELATTLVTGLCDAPFEWIVARMCAD